MAIDSIPATQEVQYLGLGIGDVLKLTAEEAADAFRVHPSIARPLATLSDLGWVISSWGRALIRSRVAKHSVSNSPPS